MARTFRFRTLPVDYPGMGAMTDTTRSDREYAGPTIGDMMVAPDAQPERPRLRMGRNRNPDMIRTTTDYRPSPSMRGDESYGPRRRRIR